MQAITAQDFTYNLPVCKYCADSRYPYENEDFATGGGGGTESRVRIPILGNVELSSEIAFAVLLWEANRLLQKTKFVADCAR